MPGAGGQREPEAAACAIYLENRYIALYIGSMNRHHDRHCFAHPDGPQGPRPHGQGHHRHGHRSGGRGGTRLFDYGEIRLVALSMIAAQPRHGYELMKAIEDRMAGAYSPSPGVIYPTLSWLEDMGYTAVTAEEGGRKRYRITGEGQDFLTANAAPLEALLARIGASAEGGPPAMPSPILRAMENLKLALRLRHRAGPIAPEAADTVAALLDEAARAIERA